MLSINTIYPVSCIDGMQQMDEESVDLVITSPPYDDLRTYNDSSKWDHNVFMQVADSITRVLKPGGVIMSQGFENFIAVFQEPSLIGIEPIE